MQTVRVYDAIELNRTEEELSLIHILQEIGCSREEFEKLLEKRMGASYRAPGTAEADESTKQAESDMDVRSGSGQVPAADAAASRLAESGKVRTGSTEKKPLKEKPAQKEAEDAKTQQGMQEDDTELKMCIRDRL